MMPSTFSPVDAFFLLAFDISKKKKTENIKN